MNVLRVKIFSPDIFHTFNLILLQKKKISVDFARFQIIKMCNGNMV